MLTSRLAGIGLFGVLLVPTLGDAQNRVLGDSSLSRIMTVAHRGEFPTDAVVDILRQRKGTTTLGQRRALSDSLVALIVSKRGRSASAVDAILAIGLAGQPAAQMTGAPDADAMNRLIDIDRRLNGVQRATIIKQLSTLNLPGAALPYLRSLATSVMTVDANAALRAIFTLALGESGSPSDHAEARRHLREMWDGDLVPFRPARNELTCFAAGLDWPKKSWSCHRD